MSNLGLSKQIKRFISKALGGSTVVIRPAIKSVEAVAPGDVYLFRYHLNPKGGTFTRGQRVVLIVSNNRGPMGSFVSTRNNLLLSCFRLNEGEEKIGELLVENLYKNRDKCNYYKIKESLMAILGTDSYRTYKFNSQLYEFRELFVKDHISNPDKVKVDEENG